MSLPPPSSDASESFATVAMQSVTARLTCLGLRRKKPFATKLRMIDDALEKYESMQKGRVVR